MADEDKEIIDPNTIDVKKRLKDFTELLESIEDVSDKKKQLWIEIYENAICDRQNSYVMFEKLVTIAEKKSSEHAVHGRTMATYIERMSKANDQLIRLAELIAKSEEGNNGEKPIDPDEMFERINAKKK